MAINERDTFLNSINLNADSDFPYLVLDFFNGRIEPRTPAFRVMHWHEDLQFLLVTRGTVNIRTLDKSIRLPEGSGAFINKNTAHQVLPDESAGYNCFIFPERFVGFYPGSPAMELNSHIIGNANLPILELFPDGDWRGRVLSIMRRLLSLERDKSAFYPYKVLCALSSAWSEILCNAAPPEGPAGASEMRIRGFLRFIADHYGEDISLSDIAGSEHVSESECLRCFRGAMQTTPYRYLTEFRLSRAAELLRNTDDSINEIASAAGFRQPSHFGKCFREKTGLSPREYRLKSRVRT